MRRRPHINRTTFLLLLTENYSNVFELVKVMLKLTSAFFPYTVYRVRLYVVLGAVVYGINSSVNADTHSLTAALDRARVARSKMRYKPDKRTAGRWRPKNFHLRGYSPQGVGDGSPQCGSGVKPPLGGLRGRSSSETEAVCRHCLQILTAETVRI